MSVKKLDGKTWLNYSISVWNDIRKSKEEAAIKHPAMFPSQLPGRLIEIYTNEGDIVLDPFAGTGSTLVAAREHGRIGIGLDISDQFINIANSRLNRQTLLEGNYSNRIIKDSAIHLHKYVQPQSVQLTVTSPPYWDILKQKRSADYKEIRHYGDLEGDLGSISDYNEFLKALQEIFSKVYAATQQGGFCIIIVMDIRKKNQFFPFHMDLASKLNEINFTLDDIIIWDRRQEYNNLRPLGYPHVFRVNKIHEYILIFRKGEK